MDAIDFIMVDAIDLLFIVDAIYIFIIMDAIDFMMMECNRFLYS